MCAYHARRPVWGQANQPEGLASFPPEIENTLASRRGYLCLLCARDADPSAAQEMWRRYYNDRHFDILTSLRDVFGSVRAADQEAERGILAAMVVLGLDVYAVGVSGVVAWLVRHNDVKHVWHSTPMQQRASVASPNDDSAIEEPLEGQWRLTPGDAVVLAAGLQESKIGPRRLLRALRARGSANAQAGTVARMAGGARRPPVIVVQIPGFAPVPEMGPVRRWSSPRPEQAAVQQQQYSSPVRVAVIIAVVAIGVTLAIERPHLSQETVSSLYTWMLTPVPTATTAGRPAQPEETSLPARAATVPSAPHLLSPSEDDTVPAAVLTFRWAWEGALAEDEHFDVRVGRLGDEKKSVGWTQDRSLDLQPLGTGLYSWTVVVVRGHDGVVDQQLSEEPDGVSFRWQAGGGG